MLEELATTVNQIGLNRTLPAGTKFFRVRTHGVAEEYTTAKELGPPPNSVAKAGRMSAAGIPVFYGALDEETAVAETMGKDPAASIGTFELMRDLSVLDLNRLPGVPSIFDQSQIGLRTPLRFLHHFRYDISQPIELDGREHVEYTPTQVVSEFIKHRFRDAEGRSVEGVLYPSARRSEGINIVLFVESENVDGVPVESYIPPERVLRLVGVKKVRFGDAEEASASRY